MDGVACVNLMDRLADSHDARVSPLPAMIESRETETFLHRQIPLSRAMGVAVEESTEERFVLTAPLAANRNHLGTAFGGSLSAIATLAGYGMLWLRLGDSDAHIVIKSSSIRYLHPVRGDIRAVCETPDPETFSGFLDTFVRKGKARIRLEVEMVEDGRECVRFSGEFVAMR
jgi:thioesterase domain-containing protein